MSPLANTFKVAIFDEFFEAFAQLPRAQQKKTREFLRKFRQNPTDPSINYEKIHSFVDPNLRTVRIDQAYRAVVLKPESGNVYGMLWVDHHDEAMAWAAHKRCAINAELGAIQIYDMVEAPPVEVALPVAAPKLQPLFKAFSDLELVGIGVPEDLLPLVRAFVSSEDLDAAQKQLPSIAFEGLSYLAGGEVLEDVRKALGLDKPAEPVAADDFAAALANDSSKTHFVVVEDDEALEAMLDAPLERWRIFLHPSQRQMVERQWNGPVRVLGGAGTGKTVVAMHRAAWLAKSVFIGEQDKILFTTFTKNLAEDIGQNLDKLLDGAARKRVEVLHLDAWVARALKVSGYNYTIAYWGGENGPAGAAWEQALSAGSSDYSPAFYREEWERVVLAQGCATEADYLKASRAGRGLRLERAARKKIWPVFEAYRNALEAKMLKESGDAVRDATQLLRSGKASVSYRAVIVDEAQDLPTASFELVRAMVPPSSNDLFIVGDAHQRIYGRMVNLGKAGIQIVGRSKRLRVNYRTTEEIRQFAVAQLEGVHVDDLDDGMDSVKGYRSLTKGPAPTVSSFSDLAKEAAAIAAFAKQGEMERTCLVARTNPWVQKYAQALEELGLKTRLLSRDVRDVPSEPGLRLATMHRVKGLEFDRMIVAGVNEKVVPLASALESASDEAAREDAERRERSLFYVALTRARREVLITSHGEPSRWLGRCPAGAV